MMKQNMQTHYYTHTVVQYITYTVVNLYITKKEDAIQLYSTTTAIIIIINIINSTKW